MSQVASNVVSVLPSKGKSPSAQKTKSSKVAPKQKSAPKVDKVTSKSKVTKVAPKIDKVTSKGKSKVTSPSKSTKVVKTTSKQNAIASKSAEDRKASFYLSDEQTEKLRDEWKETKVLPIPYNSGAYRSFLLALVNLGVNKCHPFKTVKAEMKAIMSAPHTKVDGKTQWERFANKEAHTDVEENALNVDGKIHQNAEVLQRLGGNTCYGMKLFQMGAIIGKSKGVVVDVVKGKDGKEKQYRLNLNAPEPTNDFRKRRQSK